MKTHRHVWLLLALVLTRGLAARGATVREFRFCRDVGPSEFSTETVACIPFDAHVFANSADGFADIRIFSDRHEVPYMIETPAEVETRTVHVLCSSEIVTVRELPGNRIEIRARLDKKSWPATAVELVTPLRDFEKRVTVHGREGDGDWQVLARDAPIFDLTRFMDASDTHVELAANECREFRIEIGDVTDTRQGVLFQLTRESQAGVPSKEITTVTKETRDFRVEKVVFRRAEQQPTKRRDRTEAIVLSDFETRRNAGKKQTEVLIRAGRLPVVGLTLETGSRNFSRTVVLQREVRTPGPSQWVEVARATLSRLEFQQYSRRKLSLRFGEIRENVLRLLILDGDSPPLEVTGIVAEARIHHALFLADPGRSYTLYYGGATAFPKYDAAAVLGHLRSKGSATTVELPLGDAAKNPAYGRAFTLSYLLNSKVVLLLVMAIMVAALGWAVVAAMRKIDRLEPEDETQDR